jgi:hypothetical protein
MTDEIQPLGGRVLVPVPTELLAVVRTAAVAA